MPIIKGTDIVKNTAHDNLMIFSFFLRYPFIHLNVSFFIFWLNVDKCQGPKYIGNIRGPYFLDFALFFEFYFPCRVLNRFMKFIALYTKNLVFLTV